MRSARRSSACIPLPPTEAHDHLADESPEYPSVRAWHWVNSDGKIVASSDRRAIDLDISDRRTSGSLRDGGQSWTISDMLTDRVTGEPTFVIARRVADEDGTLRGVVSATVDIGKLGTHLLATHREEEGFIRRFRQPRGAGV